jgi:hypothetical protein
MGEAPSKHGRQEKCTQSIVGIPQRKRPLGRRKSGWQDDIKVYLKNMCGVRIWAASIWLRIRTNFGIL